MAQLMEDSGGNQDRAKHGWLWWLNVWYYLFLADETHSHWKLQNFSGTEK
jgi:hypothetical protein